MLSATRLPSAQRAFGPAVPAARPSVAVRARLSTAKLVETLGKDQMKTDLPRIQIGDSVKVGLAVVEGKGKTRTQRLEGVIIADDGAGINKTVTFRRVFQGVGIELVLPVHSPVVQSVDVLRNGRVRRSKLYYLRERVGKAAKLREVLVKKQAK